MSRPFARILASLSAGAALLSPAFGANPPPEPIPPPPPPKEDCCEDCMNKDGGDATKCAGLPECSETSSVYFSIDLGRTQFHRNMNEVSNVLAGVYNSAGEYDNYRDWQANKIRSPKEVSEFYRQSPQTALRSFKMWMYSPRITPEVYETDIMDLDLGANPKGRGQSVISSTHQVLTEDYFTSVNRLVDARSALPLEIQAQLPVDSEGFVVRVWKAGEQGEKTGTTYPLPSTPPVGYTVFYNPSAPVFEGRLNIIHRTKFNETTYKTVSYCHHDNQDTDDWLTTMHSGLPSGPVIKETVIDNTPGPAGTLQPVVRLTTVKEASLNAFGTYGPLKVVSVVQEKWGGGPWGTYPSERIEGFGGSAPRVITYEYHMDDNFWWSFGRLAREVRNDGSYEGSGYGYPAPETAGFYISRSWKGGLGDSSISGYGERRTSNAYKGYQNGVYLNYSITGVTKAVDGVIVANEAELWDVNEMDIYRRFTKASMAAGGSYSRDVTGYYADGRVRYRESPNGTAEIYTYTVPDSAGRYTQTVQKGAGNRDGVTSGTRVESTRNREGYTVVETTFHFHGNDSVQLSHWASVSEDFFGRPTKRVYNADPDDYDETVYSCCGIASFRDRNGVITQTFQDDLKRVWKQIVTTGTREVTTLTSYDGLETTVRRQARMLTGPTGFLDVLVSKTKRSLRGEIESITTPDQNNDGLPEVTTRTLTMNPAGRTESIVHPDGGTEINEYFADGQLKSITGTAVAHKIYDYGVEPDPVYDMYASTWSQVTSPSTSSPNGEWVKSYTAMGGSRSKVVYPGGGTESFTYYNVATGPLGSRGKLLTRTDADGVATTYTYDGEGGIASISEVMPGSAGNRVTTYSHEAFDDPGSLTIGWVRNTTKVNGITTSVVEVSGDGLRRREESLGRVTTTVIDHSPATASWTRTVTHPDSTKTVQEYTGDLLISDTRKNSAGGTVESTTYTYDSLGRLAASIHSRTGTTTYGPYTESGNLLSKTDTTLQSTSFTYDVMGRLIRTDAPDTLDASGNVLANIAHTSYYPNGLTEAVWGDQTYPTFHRYDEQGRMVELRTYRNLAHGTKPTATSPGADLTTWAYDAGRGWLVSKRDNANKGANYSYTAAGRLKTRTWARGIHTRYDYSQGKLAAVRYFTSAASDSGSNSGNDPNTADLGYTYDSFGRATHVSRGGVSHFTYNYDPAKLYLTTEAQNDVPFEQRVLTRKRDSLLRSTGYLFGTPADPDKLSEVTYGYDTAGRLAAVTYQRVPGDVSPPVAQTFGYDYEGGSRSLVKTVTGPVHTVENSWHAEKNLLELKENEAGATMISSFDYSLNHLGQRTGLGIAGAAIGTAATWVWGYDAKGQVVSANGSSGGGTADDRFYDYDSIGNRKQSRVGTATSTGGTATNYYAEASATTAGGNGLNQYEAIVTGATTNNPQHDDDGNLTDSGIQYSYVWDGENRLIRATPRETWRGQIRYSYDHLGRMFLVSSYSWNSGTSQWVFSHSTKLAYDGWNRIESFISWAQYRQEYVWGLDLSATLQGAGGVGGMLLWNVSVDSGITYKNYYPCYDGNGNVTELLNDSAAVAAHWEYDAFGNTLRSTPWTSFEQPPNLFEFRFSTKPRDFGTGLYYYGYRHYDPVTGRWPSRDPIQERGGVNLYGYVFNNPLYYFDILGREPKPCEQDLSDNPKKGEVSNGDYAPATNCHGYACNNWDQFGPDLDGGWLDKEFTCKEVIAAYKKDGAIDVPKGGCCPKDYHKVYVVVDPGKDFHIYRQDSDGGWSHALPDESAFATTLETDGAGNDIVDPSKSSHDYSKPNKERPPESGMGNGHNYKDKCGFLCVKTNP